MSRLTIISILICALLSGCVEEQAKTPVWGKGELTPEYIALFGDDNGARLNKAQNDLLNKHDALLRGLNQTTDGKTTHMNGIVDIMLNLKSRVKALEAVDPNDYRGPQGDIGLRGEQGEKGPKGDLGDFPARKKNGVWYIGGNNPTMAIEPIAEEPYIYTDLNDPTSIEKTETPEIKSPSYEWDTRSPAERARDEIDDSIEPFLIRDANSFYVNFDGMVDKLNEVIDRVNGK